MHDNELIYIKTDKVSVTIKGPGPKESFFNNHDSSVTVFCQDKCKIELAGGYVAQTERSVSDLWEIPCCPLFFEQQNYELIIESEGEDSVVFWHDNYNIRKRITPVGKSMKILTGIINWGNEIGFSDLIINVNGKKYLQITVEIFPSKLSYKDDYKAIINDVSNEVYNLAFDVLKKTYSSFNSINTTKPSDTEFFSILRAVFEQYIRAVDILLRNPHHILQKEYQVCMNHKANKVDNRTLKWLEKHPEHIRKSANKLLVEKALTVRKNNTYHTKENRMVKYILEKTICDLVQFRSKYMQLGRETDPEIINCIKTMVSAIKKRSNHDFLKNTEALPSHFGSSLVFSMAPGYRELFKYYLLLQRGLALVGDMFKISLKDLAELYEYWCFIKLNSLLKNKYQLISQDIIKVQRNKVFISLAKGRQSQVKYLNPNTGENIILSYNPKEINVPTITQRPDNILQLSKKGAKINYEYVFDAKYRINMAEEGSAYRLSYHTPGPQEGDINTMHRYRDAIVYQNNGSPFEKIMFGAYVLFPYHDEEEYLSHKFYKSIEKVNIGGLPFLPSSTRLVDDLLEELIEESPESADERAILPKGIEDRLLTVDWDTKDVLIGSFRKRSHFQWCLENTVYFIPAEKISNNRFPLRYVALYQTPRIFSGESGILYYGKVINTFIINASEIEGADLSKEEPYKKYMCFKVAEWKALDKVILPKEADFSMAYTNIFLLNSADYVPELLLDSELQFRLYTELKRRVGDEVRFANSQFVIENIQVEINENNFMIYENNSFIASYDNKEFNRAPGKTFKKIIDIVSAQL